MKKGKYRDKCGDCYYNGNCTINLRECYFFKKQPKIIDED